MNKAIKAKVISSDNYPFKNYEIPSGRNVKKSLKNYDVDKILYHLPGRLHHQKAINY